MKLDGPHQALVFGRTVSTPFDPYALTLRADKARRAAKLDRITPHECRHTYTSLMGHAKMSVTRDRYAT